MSHLTLAIAIQVAAVAAATMGHVLAHFEKDTIWSAVAICTSCGRLAAVDISGPAEDAVQGRALHYQCQGVPHVDQSKGRADDIYPVWPI